MQKTAVLFPDIAKFISERRAALETVTENGANHTFAISTFQKVRTKFIEHCRKALKVEPSDATGKIKAALEYLKGWDDKVSNLRDGRWKKEDVESGLQETERLLEELASKPGPATLDEVSSKKLLSLYGIATPREELAPVLGLQFEPVKTLRYAPPLGLLWLGVIITLKALLPRPRTHADTAGQPASD